MLMKNFCVLNLAIEYCKNGIREDYSILNALGEWEVENEYCCDLECGYCGGLGCSNYPGGAEKCCPGTIKKKSNKECSSSNDTVCRIPSDIGMLSLIFATNIVNSVRFEFFQDPHLPMFKL